MRWLSTYIYIGYMLAVTDYWHNPDGNTDTFFARLKSEYDKVQNPKVQINCLHVSIPALGGTVSV